MRGGRDSVETEGSSKLGQCWTSKVPKMMAVPQNKESRGLWVLWRSMFIRIIPKPAIH